MPMRLWLPTALGLVLAALVAAYATTGRRSPAADTAPLAEQASAAEPPHGAPAVSGRRQKFLPSVPADPARPAPAAPPDEVSAPAVAATPEARERDQQLERLRASGPDVGGLIGKVQAMQGDWQALAARSGIDVQVSPLECYQAGCFSTLIFKARDSIEDLTSKIFDSRAMADWAGPKTRSAPLARPDGGAEVTWLLLPPADAAAVTN